MNDTMEHVFGPAGALAQHLPEHEDRPSQRRMAEAAAELLAKQVPFEVPTAPAPLARIERSRCP